MKPKEPVYGMKNRQLNSILSMTGIAACLLVYILLGGEKQNASPLALIIIAAAGWFVSFRWKLAGSIVLFTAAAALLVHPLLYSSSFFYSLFSLLATSAGISSIIRWWNENDN